MIGFSFSKSKKISKDNAQLMNVSQGIGTSDIVWEQPHMQKCINGPHFFIQASTLHQWERKSTSRIRLTTCFIISIVVISLDHLRKNLEEISFNQPYFILGQGQGIFIFAWQTIAHSKAKKRLLHMFSMHKH